MVSSQEPNAHKLCVGLARTYKYNYRYCTVLYIRHIIQGGGGVSTYRIFCTKIIRYYMAYIRSTYGEFLYIRRISVFGAKPYFKLYSPGSGSNPSRNSHFCSLGLNFFLCNSFNYTLPLLPSFF